MIVMEGVYKSVYIKDRSKQILPYYLYNSNSPSAHFAPVDPAAVYSSDTCEQVPKWS